MSDLKHCDRCGTEVKVPTTDPWGKILISFQEINITRDLCGPCLLKIKKEVSQ